MYNNVPNKNNFNSSCKLIKHCVSIYISYQESNQGFFKQTNLYLKLMRCKIKIE